MRCKIVKAQKVMCQNNKKSTKSQKSFGFTLQYRCLKYDEYSKEKIIYVNIFPDTIFKNYIK